MMGKNLDCTVLVTSCDAYRDVERPFLTLFRRYWPDCPFELVVNGETGAEPGFDREVLCGKGKTWSQMLVEALDAISTPYVIMLMNDYLLNAPVDTELMLRRLGEAKQADALNYRLCPDPPRAEKNTAYAISCKAGIWNRGFLRSVATRTKSAWEFERYGSYMFDLSDSRPLLVTARQEFPFVDAVHKGYWEPEGMALLRREGLESAAVSRGVAPWSVRVKELLKNWIFRISPEGVTRIQNIFNAGKK